MPTQIKQDPEKKARLLTHDGHRITVKQSRFIDEYIECGIARQAAIRAGYSKKCPGTKARDLLALDHIKNEISYRLEAINASKIAGATEIMEYYSSVMRGEVKDQFGLEAPLSERTKAASELAKRMIDIPNKLEGKEQAEVKVVLDFKR